MVPAAVHLVAGCRQRPLQVLGSTLIIGGKLRKDSADKMDCAVQMAQNVMRISQNFLGFERLTGLVCGGGKQMECNGGNIQVFCIYLTANERANF